MLGAPKGTARVRGWSCGLHSQAVFTCGREGRVHTHLVLREAREQLARQLLSINSELEMAREIRCPSCPRNSPDQESGNRGALSSMTSVAGDFYDFIVVDEKHLGILVADVSGHGLPAALIASMLKAALSAQSAHACDPARVLAGLNQSLCGKFKHHFATAAYAFGQRIIHCCRPGSGQKSFACLSSVLVQHKRRRRYLRRAFRP